MIKSFVTLVKEKGDSILIGMLLLFFVSDGLNVLLSHSQNFVSTYLFTSYIKLSAISKGIALGFILSYFFIQREYLNRIILIVLVFCLFAAVGVDFSDNQYTLTWFIRFFKLSLPFLLYYFIKDSTIKLNHSVFKVLAGLMFFQSLTVVAAFMFDWPLFLTYGMNRFGYSGFLLAQNEATFYYVIAFVFLVAQYRRSGQKQYLLSLILVFVASVLLGTKAVFIFCGSLFIYWVFVQNRFNKVLLLFVGVLIGGGLFYNLYLMGVFDFYLSYLAETNWLTMITSFRNLLIQERLPVVFQQWSWYNYLVGGVNPATSFVEMDVIDLFTFGGIIGSLLYYFVLFRVLFNFSKKNYLGWFLVSQYFIIGGLAGHVFASGINAIYLALTCYFLQQNDPGRSNGFITTENKLLPKLGQLLSFKV